MSIDLSLLPPPAVIEPLDFETILGARKSRLLELLPADQRDQVAATLALESEPLTIQQQQAAYRELLLRDRVNDVARRRMLAFATGSDLDHIAASYDVARQLIDAGDATANPPRAAVWESDERLRRRTQMALESATVAGSRGAYIFHALSASPMVRDVDVSRPAPGTVLVSIISTATNLEPDAELLATVSTYLSADTRRPLNDTVIVAAAELIDYDITATLRCYPGPSSATVLDAALIAVLAYVDSVTKIGHDVSDSGIKGALHRPGVQRVIGGDADLVIGETQCSRCTAINITLGAPDV